MRFLKSMIAPALLLAAALFATAQPAQAAACNTTVFSSTNGDVNLPLCPPTNSGATPGQIDNMAIGSNTPSTVRGSSLASDSGTKTASATGTTTGAATLNKTAGTVTSASLTTAAAGLYTLTITDSAIAATDQVMATVGNGTNTGGAPNITSVTPAAGSLVVVVKNIDASAAFNGTITVSFVAFKN